MIHGEQAQGRTILDIIRDSKFTFYLTGSRFFKMDNSKSDWDFFVLDSYEVKEWLYSQGFYEIGHGYSDLNTAYTFRHANFIQPFQVDVQCVKDVALKQSIQDAMLRVGAIPPK